MKILIIDIETTGFLPKGKIVEVGIVELDLTTGKRKILFDKCVKEKGLALSEMKNAWIVQNSDLTPNEVMNAEAFDDLKPEIQKIIDKYPKGATAFNKSFDFDFLRSRGIRIDNEVACPMLVSTNICKLPATRGRKGYKWPKVEEAYDFFFPKNSYTEKHRGADDAMHEAEIVYELYKMGKITV